MPLMREWSEKGSLTLPSNALFGFAWLGIFFSSLISLSLERPFSCVTGLSLTIPPPSVTVTCLHASLTQHYSFSLYITSLFQSQSNARKERTNFSLFLQLILLRPNSHRHHGRHRGSQSDIHIRLPLHALTPLPDSLTLNWNNNTVRLSSLR